MAASSKPTDEKTDLYNRNLTSRKYALFGMTCSNIFSCSCIVAGTVTLAKRGVSGVAVANFSPREGEILALTLNLIVMLCTESIGFVHSISLRSALASESRFCFNTNLGLPHHTFWS
ncbi:uncharacterized protein BJ212DRAFT_1358606 [Suillus subaureus]|uniref:Uncharacterized protein n=1 Tax=Suillus subaureus TaxID=48587 RepID=A0A9P7EAH3_9AGAM|nr:uncharacterized protein BJ212DRAFT_1358606 [Suillus subaureus]KAG1815773.1 hypothetical protein BJ212DRAFT_1358606 [Suillus subaureus]